MRRVVMVLLMVLAGGLVKPSACAEPNRQPDGRVDAAAQQAGREVPKEDVIVIRQDSDKLNPKAFVSLREVDNKGKTRLLLDSAPTKNKADAVNAEIDENSKIVVSFDKDLMRRKELFDAFVSITGKLNGADIEIPSYTMLGVDKQIIPAKMGEIDNLLAAISQLIEMSNKLNKVSEKLPTGEVPTLSGNKNVDFSKIFNIEQDILSTAEELKAEKTHKDEAQVQLEILKGIIKEQRDQQILQDSILFERAINHSDDKIRELNTRIKSLDSTKTVLLKEFKTTEEKKITQLIEIKGAIYTATKMSNRVDRLLQVLQEDVDGKVVFKLCGMIGVSGETFVAAVDQVRASISAMLVDYSLGDLGTRDIGEKELKIVRDFCFGVMSIGADCERIIAGKHEIRTRLMDMLRDTEVLLPVIGAKDGDVLLIEIANQSSLDGVPRKYQARFLVKRFGLERQVRDSFLFLRRQHVADLPAAETDSAASRPAPVNFEPCAGMSLLWTYHPRPLYPQIAGAANPKCYSLVGNRLGRLLEPGFGVNVSFPRFNSRVVDVTLDPAAEGGTKTVIEYENGGNKVDVAAGLVLTLFDDAIFFTYGWNLSVEEKREYVGVGFSFLDFAQRMNKN